MMKTLLTFILLALTFVCKAQITFEKYYPTGSVARDNLHMVHLSYSGYKYALYNDNTLNLYNLDHSVFKTLPFPVSGGVISSGSVHIYYISEELFNTDSTDVEYFLFYSDRSYLSHSLICDEHGNVLFSKDSTVMTLTSEYGSEDFIAFTPSGTKMIIWNNRNGAYVYSLPGSLPCHDCFNKRKTGSIFPGDGSLDCDFSNPYPNPSTNQATIEYSLPDGIKTASLVIYNNNGEEVKRLKVDDTFNNIIISTSEFLPGIYYYHFQYAKGTTSGKKMMVIK